MDLRRTRLAVLAIGSAIGVTAVCRATDNHTYGPNEYAIVRNGMAPNHRWSIASHGDGEDGYDNFHVYLMAEPGHKRVGPLEEIAATLDTGPKAFHAAWAPDSGHVAIGYRVARHHALLVMYRIANRRAFPIAIPDVLSRALSGRQVPHDAEEMRSGMVVRWIGAGRFRCTRYGAFQAPSQAMKRILGKYAHVSRLPSDGRYWAEVSIDAVCSFDHDRVRIESLRPTR